MAGVRQLEGSSPAICISTPYLAAPLHAPCGLTGSVAASLLDLELLDGNAVPFISSLPFPDSQNFPKQAYLSPNYEVEDILSLLRHLAKTTMIFCPLLVLKPPTKVRI